MLFIAIVVFVLLYIKEIQRLKLNPKHAAKVMIHFAVWTFVGIHFFHVLFVSRKYCQIVTANAGNDSAGTALGVIAFVVYLCYYKQDIAKYLDAIAIPLMAGASIVRIGCAIIGDELAFPTSMPWGIYYSGELRHPIGIYYFVVSLLIVVALFYLRNKGLKKGNLFISAALMYCSTRILLDFFRESPAHDYLGFSVHQIAYGIFLILGIVFFVMNNKQAIMRKLNKCVVFN